MNLFEFLYFGFYLGFLTSIIVMVQLLEVTNIREQQIKKVEVVEEPWEESDIEDMKEPFDPEKENFTMTENPMLRHRSHEVEPVN